MSVDLDQFVADEELDRWLRELRLTHIRTQLPSLLVEAGEAELNLRDFLIKLCRHERDGKRRQRAVRYLKQARFPRECQNFRVRLKPPPLRKRESFEMKSSYSS